MSTFDPSRQTPHAPEAERAILGQAMLDSEVLSRVCDFLWPEHFYREAHQRLWRLMLDMADRGLPLDMVAIVEEAMKLGITAEIGGDAYVSALPDCVPSTVNARHYAAMVREAADRRSIIDKCRRVAEMALSGDDLERVIGELQADDGLTATMEDDIEPIAVVMERIALALPERCAQQERGIAIGLPLPVRDLARYLTVQVTDLVIVAARPAMGKSALAFQWMVEAAAQGVPGLICSLEMASDQLGERAIASAARIDLKAMVRGALDSAQLAGSIDAAAELARLPLWLCDRADLSVEDIRARVRRMKLGHPDLSLVMVDYIGLVKRSNARMSTNDATAHVSRMLKVVAKESKVAVLALCQLNRNCEDRNDKRPLMADLRDSGAIEQDADKVLMIYRDEVYNEFSPAAGTAEILIRKNRNGSPGTVECAFIGEHTRFDDLARNHDDNVLPYERGGAAR